LEAAAEALGVKLLSVEARRPDDLEGAFAIIATARSDALLLSPDILILRNRKVILDLAARYKIPAAYPIREFAADGGLLSYGTNYSEA
jgi:putative ABC transport system substrate-binding protein